MFGDDDPFSTKSSVARSLIEKKSFNKGLKEFAELAKQGDWVKSNSWFLATLLGDLKREKLNSRASKSVSVIQRLVEENSSYFEALAPGGSALEISLKGYGLSADEAFYNARLFYHIGDFSAALEIFEALSKQDDWLTKNWGELKGILAELKNRGFDNGEDIARLVILDQRLKRVSDKSPSDRVHVPGLTVELDLNYDLDREASRDPSQPPSDGPVRPGGDHAEHAGDNAPPLSQSSSRGAFAPPPIPPTERQVNIWVGDGTEGLRRALKIGETYVLNFKIGQPVSGSLTSGTAAAVGAGDVPHGGLWTQWMVVSQGAELAVGTPDTKVSVKTVDGIRTWSGRFELVIPEAGDSAVPQLLIKPLRAGPSINVVITTRNEVYRQFELELVVSHSPSAALVEPTAIAAEVMPTPTAHSTLRATHEWTTPNGVLNIVVGQPMATVVGNSGELQIVSDEPWVGAPALVSGKIESVRGAAELMRAAWEDHLNNIDPTDLENRLRRWSELNRTHQHGQGGPEYDWESLGDHADPQHRQQWEKMAVSSELRKLAWHGQQLFLAFFKRDSNLNGWIAGLPPGARLNIVCTPTAGAGFIPHVPWGLMYVADVPPEGHPIDPMGFLGLRCRIGYTSHAAQASRSLGALDATHRMHFLYWGSGANDVTGQEARWQRNNWSAWQNQVFVPQSPQNQKAELLQLLNDPRPTPTSVLYLFCQCGGQPNNPMLRFGSTNDPANVVLQMDFGTSPLADRPLVFANACTTLANDPYMASDLEEAFFNRGCRAYIGTETKVPIVFGSRFADIFFRFFYRLLDSAPMAAGEAVTQTRLFLWTHYRNIGGLFYTHVNQYDLFLAPHKEVVALRAPSMRA
jgi:hypothetical protein